MALPDGLPWARRSAHPDRQAGPTGQAPAPSRVRLEPCGAGGGRPPAPASRAAEPFPSPRLLPPVPNRLCGELGGGGDVKLGEQVREMSLHGTA